MEIQNLTSVSTVVINSLLILLKDNHVDIDSVVMQLSNNKDEALSPEVNLMELVRQTLGELEKAKASLPEGFVLVPKEPTLEMIAKGHDVFVGAFDSKLNGGQSLHCAYLAMIEAQEQSSES